MSNKEIRKKIQQLIAANLVSISRLQRLFWIGYSRAAKICDALIDEGCVLIGKEYQQYSVNEKQKDKIASIIITNLPAYQENK